MDSLNTCDIRQLSWLFAHRIIGGWRFVLFIRWWTSFDHRLRRLCFVHTGRTHFDRHWSHLKRRRRLWLRLETLIVVVGNSSHHFWIVTLFQCTKCIRQRLNLFKKIKLSHTEHFSCWTTNLVVELLELVRSLFQIPVGTSVFGCRSVVTRWSQFIDHLSWEIFHLLIKVQWAFVKQFGKLCLPEMWCPWILFWYCSCSARSPIRNPRFDFWNDRHVSTPWVF